MDTISQALQALIQGCQGTAAAHAPRSVSRAGPGVKTMLALEFLRLGRPVAVLARDPEDLAELRALLELLDPESAEERYLSLPSWERKSAQLSFPPAPARGQYAGAERAAAFYALYRRPCPCLLLTPESLLLSAPPKNIFAHDVLELRQGMDMPQELITEQLTEWGYKRGPMVGEQGEFAVRGDILDIFCPGYTRPTRLEFFGDSLEDMRAFDPATQRSARPLAELTLLPASCVILSPERRKTAERFWERLGKEGLLDENSLYLLRKELEADGRGIAPGLYYEERAHLEDWLPEGTTLLLPGRADTEEALRAAASSWSAWLEEGGEERPRCPRSLILRRESEALAWLETRPRLYFEDLRVGVAEEGGILPERSIHAFQELFPLNAGKATADKVADSGTDSAAYNAADTPETPWRRLVAAMRGWSAEKNRVVILSFSAKRGRDKFLDLAGQDGIIPLQRYAPGRPGLYALISPFRRGLSLEDGKLLILGEDVLQPRSPGAPKGARAPFRGMDRYDDLVEGDFLVHRDYGICAFGGLQHLQAGGAANDFLLLRYAGDDKLYLPVDRLGLIQVFKAQEGMLPALDRLGGSQWVAGKEKARQAIEKIAEDLVEMYAYRKVAKGYSYSEPGELYREFEASFGFEETPDQARAIEETLEDMSRPEPMDRLICGDVGFGKTEVALRAAFRAALDGRQTVLLCPTTVLAEQHYQTFRSRLAGFPLHVGLLSRFVSKAKQAETLRGAARGQVDILIGTHRVLSADVALPNLGLIIMDEEQRFGVRHKEKLKQMKKNVDVLTLTATPIPRTLQLSLSGIRELSVIETPPPERKPVATALIDRDDAVLRAVLLRELERQGQIFWVHNRVQGLERCAAYVRKLVPEARIGIAHGQMQESALEENMRRFWHGELDVLVCTAIIESGLDFPRANTLVVDQAQLFGLGQLYQLRGRVGRSDRQAFAVFICRDVEKLPESSRQRLRVILDMDYLGAGLRVAMEDLRLRGAGNILGESQSGHLQRLGLDLFLEMLEEAVAKMRGLPSRETAEPELGLGIAAHIPESYISDSRERLRYYKALSSAGAEERREVELELRDRFGLIPTELQNFFSVLDFKRRLPGWGVARADIGPDSLRLHFDPARAKADPARLVAWIQANKNRAKLVPPAGLDFALRGGSVEEKLSLAGTELDPLLRGREDPSG